MEEKTGSRRSRMARRSSEFGGRKSSEKQNMNNTRRRAVPSHLRKKLREMTGKTSSIFIYMPNTEPYVTHRVTTITSGGKKIGTMVEVEYQAQKRDETEEAEEITTVEPSPKRKKRLDEVNVKVDEVKKEPEDQTSKMEQEVNKREDNNKTAELIQSVSSSVDSSQQPRGHQEISNPVWANSRRRGNAPNAPCVIRPFRRLRTSSPKEETQP